LTVELPHEVGDPQTGADVTALADDRPAPGGFASVIETEDGGDIDPVPLGWHFPILAESFLASLLGSAPVIALADVPSVDLEHQGVHSQLIRLRSGARGCRPKRRSSRRRLRAETMVTVKWIAARLGMGTASYVNNRLYRWRKGTLA
jgi:hypothetical protein